VWSASSYVEVMQDRTSTIKRTTQAATENTSVCEQVNDNYTL